MIFGLSRTTGRLQPWAPGVWGWEVWLDGMEITQFTYFQQCGGYNCHPVPIEITYGIERLAMLIQNKRTIYDIIWHQPANITYGDIYRDSEREHCQYNFDHSSVDQLFALFDIYEKRSWQSNPEKPNIPSVRLLLKKCSHTFNLLDARGAISLTERVAYISRIRHIAKSIADIYIKNNVH